MSGFSKVITSGKLGSVEVSEENGVVSLKGTVSADIGGGDLKGVVKVHNSTQIDMDAMELAFVGLDLIEAKIPSAKAPLEGLKQLIKAELPALEARLSGAPATPPVVPVVPAADPVVPSA